MTFPPAHSVVSPLHERREQAGERVLGRLVSLNGSEGVVACDLPPEEIGEHWSIGHLISLVHQQARLVGVVCELSTIDRLWSETEVNVAYVKVELSGEIVDDDDGTPRFYRGIRSYPALGAVAHRIRSDDLKAIYAFRGADGVEIGKLTQNASLAAAVSVDELVTRHFAVIGSTGVGKTTAVSMLIKKCLPHRPKLRTLIIDPHNEYARTFPRNGGARLRQPRAAVLDVPLRGNRRRHLQRPQAEPRRTRRALRRDQVRQSAVYRQLRFDDRREPAAPRQPTDGSGWISADTPVPYRVADMVHIIDEWLGKLDQRYPRSDLRALKYRLEALSRDPRFRFMFGRVVVEDNMAKVIARIFRLPKAGPPVTIVQLAGLPNEVVNSLVSVLSRMAFESRCGARAATNLGDLRRGAPLCPDRPVAGFWSDSPGDRPIAKEGRKYGVSLGIITQRPSELDSTVLSQCSTMFAMRLANEHDKDDRPLGGRRLLGQHHRLPVVDRRSRGDRLREAIATPMRMKFSDYREDPALKVPFSSDPEPNMAHLDLRKIVCRLRGEYTPETATP